MSRVLPGVPETFASPCRPVSMLMSDDLPTLLRPMKAMSFRSSFGTCEMRSDEHLNSALVICIGIWFYTKARKAGWLQNRIACGSVKPSDC